MVILGPLVTHSGIRGKIRSTQEGFFTPKPHSGSCFGRFGSDSGGLPGCNSDFPVLYPGPLGAFGCLPSCFQGPAFGPCVAGCEYCYLQLEIVSERRFSLLFLKRNSLRYLVLKFQHLEGAGNRRKPQIFAGDRRFKISQKTTGNWRLGSVTLGASPLARP